LSAQPADDELQLEEEFIRSRSENGESHASGMRPELGPVTAGNPTTANTILRVGLSYSTLNANGTINSEFSTRHHPLAEISHTVGSVHVIDESTGKQVVAVDDPLTIMRFTRDANGYHVTVGGAFIGTFDGPLFLRPTDATNQFRIEHIRRSFSGTHVPRYRGAFQLAHTASTSAGRLHVVNFVELEDYVPGVVANESIASFGIEALKAQAVAARGYAIANINRFRANFPYGIDDSTQSQVYRGVVSEHPRAVLASNQTRGLVASYNGQIIGALYSSSMGGHTENNEWIFNSPSNQWPGTNVSPYLRGIYDGNAVPAPDTTTDSGISAFWAASPVPGNFDDCTRVANRFTRWKLTFSAAEIRARIPAAVAGTVTDVAVTQRMPSGRAAQVRITLTTATGGTNVFDIRGWDPLRQFFRAPTGRTTPSVCGGSAIASSFVLNNPSVINVARNADGSIREVVVWGGGWGHNVGMSQYGAAGRALAGQSFLEILTAYYTGVDIGSYPIDIGREPGSGAPTLRQEFFVPGTTGTLYVREATMRKLRIHVNGTYDIALDEEHLADGEETVDLSGYLTPGLNVVQYNPVGHGQATVTVAVE
jgi:SpoIID/LytB domain protein